MWQTSFSIKENADVPNMGSVRVKFDNQFLVMQSAGIEGSILYGRSALLSLMGTTQVIVTVNGGIESFIQTKMYNVSVFLPALGEKSEQGSAEANSAR
jgi:hypothetical protein